MKRLLVFIISALLIVLGFYFWPTTKISWHEENSYRWRELSLPWTGRDGFELQPPTKTNITFSNNLTNDLVTTNEHLLNGSGVALGDIDNDGLTDIYLCRLDGPNALYRNLGDWKFIDVTEASGVGWAGQHSTGSAFADVDGDGDLDLLVTTLGGPNFCFRNDGQGRFTDVTEAAGLHGNSGATTMALADVDGDRDLDLYVTNYKKHTVRDLFLPHELDFDKVVKKSANGYEVIPEFQDEYTLSQTDDQLLMRYENAEPDVLYLNDGKGHFEAVPLTDGRFVDEEGKPVPELRDWGLTARFQDMDDDGDPDLLVCNDFESPDRFWINDGEGNFQALAKLAIRKTSWATMGVDFSDIDRDGDSDFLLLDMLSRNNRRRKTQNTNSLPIPHSVGGIDNRPQTSHNMLYMNRGDHTFAEIAHFSGVHASEWSWSPLFLDVDLDGFEDILIATGHFYDALDFDTLQRIRTAQYYDLNVWRQRVFEFPELQLTNLAFRNNGDLTFEEVSTKWGFDVEDISHGMAAGDLDNDGDLDLVLNRLNSVAAVYRNTSNTSRLAIRLVGLSPNTQAIGAKIHVLGGPVRQSKEVICAGNYLSSSDPLYTFAASPDDTLTIEVTWRNGNRRVIENARANRIYEIQESDSLNTNDDAPETSHAPAQPYFEDVSHLINHVHHDDDHDDFRWQPLLPKRSSQLGPGVTWFDIDRDGAEDLLLTSGKGGGLGCFRNDGRGSFAAYEDPSLSETVQSDQTIALGWVSQGGVNLLIGSTNLGQPSPGESFLSQYQITAGEAKLIGNLPIGDWSIGPLAMADYDLDGDLDLFVGGRGIPTRYPEPASSHLYLNQNDRFELDSRNSVNLRDLGLVSGAVFSDLDGDGDSDLILAVEWGPLMIFRNSGGAFSDVTESFGLAEHRGWWQGVTTGDLDEDGRLDIIATNWGLNHKYQDQYDAHHPLYVFFDDFDNNGKFDVIEAFFDPELQQVVPSAPLQRLGFAIPYVQTRVQNHKQYSQAGIQEVLGFKAKQADTLTANTLAHMVFFNRGNHFEAVALPREAQFSPAFYAGVADFDGDGHEDIFLSQNFFALQTGESRYDAGRGLWLRGDGRGNLQSIAGTASGITVYGEQRGAGLCDYDADGRVDLAVSQNGAQTKLYRNVGAAAGLRIRLAGPPGNANGIGSTIRLRYGQHFGPAREIHLGSGYWSQDSSTQVLARRDAATAVWVRWPGGKITEVEIPYDSDEITVAF